MTIYDGLELLTILPNVRTARESAVSRPVTAVENPQGNLLTATTDAPPGGTHQLDWHCATRAERVAVEAFLAARRGQSQGCWIPTYQNDAELLASVPAWVVRTSTISARPATDVAYRRWIVLGPRGLTYFARWVDNATDNGDGTTTWGTSPGAGPLNVTTMGGSALLTSQGARLSRLMLCRMTSDDYHVSYRLGHVTTISAEFVEVAGDVTQVTGDTPPAPPDTSAVFFLTSVQHPDAPVGVNLAQLGRLTVGGLTGASGGRVGLPCTKPGVVSFTRSCGYPDFETIKSFRTVAIANGPAPWGGQLSILAGFVNPFSKYFGAKLQASVAHRRADGTLVKAGESAIAGVIFSSGITVPFSMSQPDPLIDPAGIDGDYFEVEVAGAIALTNDAEDYGVRIGIYFGGPGSVAYVRFDVPMTEAP